MFLSTFAQSLPEWCWRDFRQEGNDVALDRDEVVAKVMEIYTNQAMVQALKDGTFWIDPAPTVEEIMIKKRADKILNTGSINAFIKFVNEYGIEYFLDD
jgi:hypothetical protein